MARCRESIAKYQYPNLPCSRTSSTVQVKDGKSDTQSLYSAHLNKDNLDESTLLDPMRPNHNYGLLSTHSSSHFPLRLLEDELLHPSFQHYDVMDLSRLVIARTQHPIFTSLAPSEKAWLLTDQIDFHTHWPPDEIWFYLQKFGLILDKVFFYGLVSPFVNIRYDSQSVDGGATVATFRPTNAFVWLDEGGKRGEKVEFEPGVHAGTISIHSPFVLPCSGEKFEAKLVDFVGRLAHEMLHAFFVMYSCNCPGYGDGKGGCRELNEDYKRLGKLGHGEAWCDAMFAIQSALRRDLGFTPLAPSIPSDFEFYSTVELDSRQQPRHVEQLLHVSESDRRRHRTKRVWAELDCNIGGLRSDVKAGGYEPSPEVLRRWGLEYKDEDEYRPLIRAVRAMVCWFFMLVGLKVGFGILIWVFGEGWGWIVDSG